ncbi:MAG: HAMP domain-containing protein [Acidobacteriia bacterium]|nr:HAMP domain-containing protein [Terriglobia bacterium]
MKKRLFYGFALVMLALAVLLVVWQGSFRLGQFGPANPQQTLIFWAISSLIFILIVTLGFILFREGVKLYVERQSNREGSRIKTKLVVGALTLSVVPVFFLVWFSYEVLSKNMMAWFTQPTKDQIDLFAGVANMLNKEMQDETMAQAALLAAQPETRRLLAGGAPSPGFLQRFCGEQELESAAILAGPGWPPLDTWGPYTAAPGERRIRVELPVPDTPGAVALTALVPLDVAEKKAEIKKSSDQWFQLYDSRKQVRSNYIMLMALITLFVLFLATWMALFLAKQISVPITALLEAASEVRGGNLRHRVQVRAVDELGSLVRGFNRMTEELESSGQELDRRRRFTEAILESIPTGVISLAADGSIQRVNHALAKIFPAEQAARATRLEDLFSREDAAEIRYLMKRARRTGVATRELELRTAERKLHLAVTVSALEEKLTSGFVLVLEDTSELLRAQKAAAWHEVARRVAHELKNPLTPIALSAERIERQLDRVDLPPANTRILRECAATISKSVESVKALVDEFAQFARFPSAQPVRSDLNEVVREALEVFKDRLDGIAMQTSFAPALPPVNLDREQFQRVVVNLVDNAAEAMQDSLVKKLYIATQAGAAETVELVVADSGCGVSPDDKEKLFLPYFSTKNRGTGLGLAIVSHIVAEHLAQIRVEDNQPTGARFTVEIPALLEPETADKTGPGASRPAAASV